MTLCLEKKINFNFNAIMFRENSEIRIKEDTLIQAINSVNRLINRERMNKTEIENYKTTIETLERYVKELESNNKLIGNELKSHNCNENLRMRDDPNRDDLVTSAEKKSSQAEYNGNKGIISSSKKVAIGIKKKQKIFKNEILTNEKSELTNKLHRNEVNFQEKITELSQQLNESKTLLEQERNALTNQLQNVKLLNDRDKKLLNEQDKIIEELRQEKRELMETLSVKEKIEHQLKVMSPEIISSSCTQQHQDSPVTLDQPQNTSIEQQPPTSCPCFVCSTQVNNDTSAKEEQSFILDENKALKVELIHYQISIADLREELRVKEEIYQERLRLLENELQQLDILSDYKVLGEKVKTLQQRMFLQNQQQIKPSSRNNFLTVEGKEEKLKSLQQGLAQYRDRQNFTHISSVQNAENTTIDKRISKAHDELLETLCDLNTSVRSGQALINEITRRQRNIQIKNNCNYYGSIGVTDKKRDRISSSKNHNISHKGNLNAELKELLEENEILSTEKLMIENENRKLFSKLTSYQNEFGSIGDIHRERARVIEDRKYLVEIITDYDVESQRMKEQIVDYKHYFSTCEEEYKKMKIQNAYYESTMSTFARLEGEFKIGEKNYLENTIKSLERELEFHRQNSTSQTGDCCAQTKIQNEKLNLQVKNLQEQSEQLKTQLSTLEENHKNINPIYKTQTKYNQNKDNLAQSKENVRRSARRSKKAKGKSATESYPVNIYLHLNSETLHEKTNNQEDINADESNETKVSKERLSEENEKCKSTHYEEHIHQLTLPRSKSMEKIEINYRANKPIRKMKTTKEEETLSGKEVTKLRADLEIYKTKNLELLQNNNNLKKQIQELQIQKSDAGNDEEALYGHRDEQGEQLARKNGWMENAGEQEATYQTKEHISNVLPTEAATKNDTQRLRQQVQDLRTKKVNYEGVIMRLKEEKYNLQMRVGLLERDLQNTKQKLQYFETERGQQRRNAEPFVESSSADQTFIQLPLPSSTCAQNHTEKTNYWLDSSINNQKDNVREENVSRKVDDNKPLPIWLSNHSKKIEEEVKHDEIRKTRRRPLGTAKGVELKSILTSHLSGHQDTQPKQTETSQPITILLQRSNLNNQNNLQKHSTMSKPAKETQRYITESQYNDDVPTAQVIKDDEANGFLDDHTNQQS